MKEPCIILFPRKILGNNMYVYLAVVAVIVCLLIVLLYLRREQFSDPRPDIQKLLSKIQNDEIPKIIWTYWDSRSVPDVVQKCINTWRNHNPDYEIVVLSNEDIPYYLPETDVLGMKMANTPQRTADLIRVHILEKYGGIWADATIMMNGSLDFIQSKKGYDFVGYHIGKMMNRPESPVIENWFFAAPPRSVFVKNWRECFTKINNFETPDDYVKSITDQGVDISKVESPGYLTMHVASQYVIQKQMSPSEVLQKLSLIKAEDGPLKYLHDNDWNSHKGLSSMCKDSYDHPIIKFRGTEREVIERNQSLRCIFD